MVPGGHLSLCAGSESSAAKRCSKRRSNSKQLVESIQNLSQSLNSVDHSLLTIWTYFCLIIRLLSPPAVCSLRHLGCRPPPPAGVWLLVLSTWLLMSVRATFFSLRTLALARHMDVLFAELQWVQFWKRSFWNYYHYDCYFPTFIFLSLEVLLLSEIVLMHCEPIHCCLDKLPIKFRSMHIMSKCKRCWMSVKMRHCAGVHPLAVSRVSV